MASMPHTPISAAGRAFRAPDAGSAPVRHLLFTGWCGLAGGAFAACGTRLIPNWCDGSPDVMGAAWLLLLGGCLAGAWLGWRLLRRWEPLPSVAAVLLLLLFGLVALAPLLMPPLIRHGLANWKGALPAYATCLRWQVRLLGGLLLPVGLLAGCGWALARRLHPRPLAADFTLVAGLLAGLWVVCGAVIPAWGLETARRVATLAGGVAASAALAGVLPRRPRVRVALVLLPLLLAAGLGLTRQPREPRLAQHAIGNWLATQGALSRLPGRVGLHRDGRRHALTLRPFPGEGYLLCRDGERRLAMPGDWPTVELAVHLPLLLHPDPRRLALAGVESGAGLAAAAHHPLHLIEWAGAESAHLPVMRQLLARERDGAEALDDNRVVALAHPARRHLHRSPGRYDVIVALAGPLWRAADARLLSSDSLAIARQALATNGIYCVALDTLALDPASLQQVIGRFAAVFPNMQVWSPQFNRYLLVGTAGETAFDAAQLLARLERRPVMRSLARVGVRGLPDLLACLVMTPADIARFLTEAPAAPRLFQGVRLARRAARSRLSPVDNRLTIAAIEAARTWSLGTLQPGGMEPELYDALRERATRQMAARAAIMKMRAHAGTGARDDVIKQARAAARLNPGDAFLNRLLLAIEQEAAYALARKDFAGALRLFGDVVAVVPERTSALYGAALAERGLGRDAAAYLKLSRAVAASPGEPACRTALAETAFALGREEEARQHYQTVLQGQPDDPEALIGLAICLGRGKPPVRHVGAAIEAAERAARLTRYRDLRINAVLADLYVENGRVVEGVSLKRRIRVAREGVSRPVGGRKAR